MSDFLQPQYEFYTSVEIYLTISNDQEKTFSISKTGHYLESLTIKEGTVGGAQFTPDLNGSMVASGSVSLIDEDNSIFRALITSKSTNGDNILNYLKIIIHTYSGDRKYEDCRIKNWSVSLNGGVPKVTLDWETLGSSGVQSPETPNQKPFDPDAYTEYFVKTGVESFSDFVEFVGKVFPQGYIFTFNTGLSADKIVVCGNEAKDYKDNPNLKVLRFSSKYSSLQDNIFSSIMKEFCLNCKINGMENKSLCWNFKTSKEVVLSAEDLRNRVVQYPKECDYAQSILERTVFVYNASIPQGSIYSTPWGDKIAFNIDVINAQFSMENTIISNLDTQANTTNPNGNMVMTSRGRVMLPSNMPQAITQSIHNIASVNLTDSFTVTITVYNYIHFYIQGSTNLYLVVFDHLGQIHPISGIMRVFGYEYTIGNGVISANVTLKPAFNLNSDSFYDTTSYYLRDFTVTGSGEAVEVDGDTIYLNGSPNSMAQNAPMASMMTQEEIEAMQSNSSSSNVIDKGVGTGLNVCLTLDDCI